MGRWWGLRYTGGALRGAGAALAAGERVAAPSERTRCSPAPRAGKTTLINHILTGAGGRRVCSHLLLRFLLPQESTHNTPSRHAVCERAGNHGKKVAVIENEFGEVGVDDALVMDTKEEIFEMNNGCVCCTGRQGQQVRLRRGGAGALRRAHAPARGWRSAWRSHPHPQQAAQAQEAV